MSHNPILKQQRLGRTERPEIGPHQQGVLYVKNQFRRILNPGGELSPDERLAGDLTLYIVDCAPRVMNWQVNLPTSHPNDFFPVVIKLEYKVQDSLRIVAEQVVSTEALITRAIEPLLRMQTRQYKLNQYAEAEIALQAVLTPDHLTELGLGLYLEVLWARVEIELDERARIHIEELYSIRKRSTLEEEMAELEELLRQRKLKQIQRAIDFYAPLIEEGQWQLLALALAVNEMDVKAVLDYMEAQQREELSSQLELLKNLLEKQALGTEVSGETYAVARVKECERGEPFRLHKEYLLQAGIMEYVLKEFEAEPITLPSRETIQIAITVHAEDMNIQPDFVQIFTYRRGQQSDLIEFRLTPTETGHKQIRVEFYYEQHWLAQIKFEVEVIAAEEPVPA